MGPRRRWRAAALALVALAACGKEVTAFPSGVAPWDDPATSPASEWPDWPAGPGPVAVVTGLRFTTGDTPSFEWAHGRVVVDAPLADVWAAVQWQEGAVLAVAPDTQVDCEATNRPEPEYTLSFAVKETPNANGALGRANWFKLYWRGEPTRDASQALVQVNLKAQKVDGTSYIPLMRESVVATPAPGGGTRLEIVRHINAPDETETTAADWIRLWLAALEAQLAGTPQITLERCSYP